jgi:hypothetical protein
MKRLCPPKPLVKKGNAEDRHQLRLPQYVGSPGTLYLTHDEDEQPILIFADQKESLTVLHAVLDERLFSDTVFRVVKISPTRYIVYDLVMLNGAPFHATHSYAERSSRIAELLDAFHHPDLVALETVAQAPSWELSLRGYECYDDAPGTLGVFLPVKE